MSGLELQDKMTASGYKLSVVFITGYPTDEDRRRALRGGAAQYLEKPVSADVLLSAVQASGRDSRRMETRSPRPCRRPRAPTALREGLGCPT